MRDLDVGPILILRDDLQLLLCMGYHQRFHSLASQTLSGESGLRESLACETKVLVEGV